MREMIEMRRIVLLFKKGTLPFTSQCGPLRIQAIIDKTFITHGPLTKFFLELSAIMM